MLNTFYTSLIHDSQVLILEALERLEKDYKGGHREESIASIEQIASHGDEADDDAAWTQILRDLQDVGVSQQEALSYRNIIVDWLVTAVNDGRLLEQRPQHHGLASLSHDLGTALPPLDQMEERESYTPLPPGQRNTSAPLPTLPLLVSPPLLEDQRDQGNPSAGSLPISGQSNTSIHTTSPSSDVDTSSERVSVPQPTASNVQPGSTTLPEAPPSHLEAPSTPPTTSSFPTHTAFDLPPTYYEKGTSITLDLDWTAQQIEAAWSRRDFHTAERLLGEQLAAVERGQTVSSGTQPDRRILRHLIGICASFTGNFTKAKRFFDSVFNGIYLNRASLDDGDIAAARWLGDVCLHLREHHNAVLAYSVAFEGSIGRFGIARDRTRRLSEELRLLDHWLYAFRRVEQSFSLNTDPTDIFASAHAVEKSNLTNSVKAQLYSTSGSGDGYPAPPLYQFLRPSFLITTRPRTELMLSENFLLAPLISLSAWPFPWDPTFSPADAVQLNRYMNTVPSAKGVVPLIERSLPTKKLGESKKLHYVTKRSSQWLIESVKTGLQDMGIEHAEHGYETSIVCCLNQHRDGFAFSEGIQICFSKLQFRNVYGLKVTDVHWATRRIAATSIKAAQLQKDTTDFRDIVKGILERAEADVGNPAPESTTHNVYPVLLQTPGSEKRPTYG